MCARVCVRVSVYMRARGWRSGSGGLAMSSLKTFWRAGFGVSFSVRCHSRPFRAAPSGGPRKALVSRRRPPLLLQAAPARPAQALHRPPIHHCSVMLNPSPSSSCPQTPPWRLLSLPPTLLMVPAVGALPGRPRYCSPPPPIDSCRGIDWYRSNICGRVLL